MMITIGWPQGIFLAITLFSLGIELAKHGEDKGKHDVWTSLIAVTITYGLLWWGGFFG